MGCNRKKLKDKRADMIAELCYVGSQVSNMACGIAVKRSTILARRVKQSSTESAAQQLA